MRRKYFYLLLILFVLIMSSCNNLKLNGYLFLNYYHQDYKYSIYDLKNKTNTPIKMTKYDRDSGNDFLLIYNNEVYNLKLRTNKENKTYGFTLNIYSLDENRIIKKYISNDIQGEWSSYEIVWYQILDSNTFISDHKKILKWNLLNNKVEEIYKTNNFINSFHSFLLYSIMIIDETIGLGDANSSNDYNKIFKLDLKSNKIEEFDQGGGACYSDEYSRVIYNGESVNRIKFYDFRTNEFITTKIKPYIKHPSYCFIAEDIMVLHQEVKTINSYLRILYGGDHTKYIIYNYKTNWKKDLIKGYISDGLNVNIQYLDRSVNIFHPGHKTQ